MGSVVLFFEKTQIVYLSVVDRINWYRFDHITCEIKRQRTIKKGSGAGAYSSQ